MKELDRQGVPPSPYCAQARRIRIYAWYFTLAWTLLLMTSTASDIRGYNESLITLAKAEARTAIERDVLYRSWSSSHGGVYAPVSENNPPNPYLSQVPERDIRTPSGRELTLINPAYMTRQVYELANAKGTFTATGHLTSLDPLRPENAPDSWEKKALESFERGARENSEMVQIEGAPFIRLMKAFVTEESCLQCHAAQGYKVGDVRGGLSVTLPLRPLIEATHKQKINNIAVHVVIWLLGLGMTGWAGRQLIRSSQSQQLAEEALEESNRKLEVLSLTDGLTGIANRRHFDTVLDLQHAVHTRSGAELSLILLDIDHFKAFNDCYGHVAGDECLRRIGRLIAESTTRPTDLVARYGGEEFVCILPGTDAKGAVYVAERIRLKLQTLAIPHQQSSVANCVTASLGVMTLKCTPDSRVIDIMHQVDDLLYRAKSNGRNRVEHMLPKP